LRVDNVLIDAGGDSNTNTGFVRNGVFGESYVSGAVDVVSNCEVLTWGTGVIGDSVSSLYPTESKQ
jgi:hypothetical protein